MAINFDEIFWDEERDGPLKKKRGRKSNAVPNQNSPDFIFWGLDNGYITKEEADDQFMDYLRETWLD